MQTTTMTVTQLFDRNQISKTHMSQRQVVEKLLTNNHTLALRVDQLETTLKALLNATDIQTVRSLAQDVLTAGRVGNTNPNELIGI